MKRKGLILALIALVCLLFAMTALPKNVSSVEKSSFKKITSVSELTDGNYLIVYEAGNICLDGSLSGDQAKNGVEVTINAETIEISLNYSFEIKKISDGYSVQAASGKYIYGTNGSNKLNYGSSASANTITFTDGNAVITSNTSFIQFNKASDQMRFRYYKSGTTSQQAVQLYKEVVGENPEQPGGSEKPTYADSTDVQSLVTPYYNEGTYTKKSYININQEAIEEVGKFKVNSLFVGGTRLDRTTYYWPTELLMTTIDNNYAEYNSGYGTAANGNLTQFKVDANGVKIKEWVAANPSHPNWNDKDEYGMEGFYVTLNDLVAENYFAATEENGWVLEKNVATYNITSNDEEVVKDFLAFVAPCFEPIILSETYKNFFGLAKLEIAAGTNNRVGDYLRLRIYATADCSGYVLGNENVLAEACIYKGTVEFDENNLTAAKLVEIGAKIDSFVQMPVTFVKHTKSGTTNNYCFSDLNGTEIKVSGSAITDAVDDGKLTLNDTLVLNFKATSISTEYINGNTATIVGEVTAVKDPETINSTIADVRDGKIVSQGQMVVIEGVVVSIDTAWSDDYENMTVTISDVDGNEITVFRTETPVEVGTVVAVTGKVGYHSSTGIQIAAGSTCEEIEPTTSEELAYQAIIDEKEISKLEVHTNGTEGFQVPTTGAFGSEVVWTVSPEAAVSIDSEGNVTFERGEESVAVTLVATIGAQTREFKFTIVAKPAEGGNEPVYIAKTYSYEFTAKIFSANNSTKALGNVNWKLDGTGGTPQGKDSSSGRGVQFGTKNSPYKNMTLTSASFTHVTSVTVNSCLASGGVGTISVSVGGTVIATKNLSTTSTDYVFDLPEALDGEVVISYNLTTGKAIYIKTIEVQYGEAQ